MPKLKVFSTTSGIHDHVVATTSRPAALKAWGAKTDLFSMGVAKQVTDPKIVKKALARPGEVIRVSRSGDKEEPAAPKTRANKKPRARPPSRANLAAAEKRLEELATKRAKAKDDIERQLSTLTRKRDQLDKQHAKALRAAEEKVDEARDAYQAALDDWGG